jgi:hypothetical protein
MPHASAPSTDQSAAAPRAPSEGARNVRRRRNLQTTEGIRRRRTTRALPSGDPGGGKRGEGHEGGLVKFGDDRLVRPGGGCMGAGRRV